MKTIDIIFTLYAVIVFGYYVIDFLMNYLAERSDNINKNNPQRYLLKKFFR